MKATHRNSCQINPLVFNAQQLLNAWNHQFSKKKEVRLPSIPKGSEARRQLLEAVNQKDEEDMDTLPVVTGCRKGSALVGLVRVLKRDSSQSHQSTASSEFQANLSMKFGLFVKAQKELGYKVSSQSQIKDLMQQIDVTADCMIFSQGIIPSLKCNEIGTIIKTLNPEAKDMMKQLAYARSSTAITKFNQVTQARSDFLNNVVTNVLEKEEERSKVIDTNTLMDAAEDFNKQCREGTAAGIPMNHEFTWITRKQVAMHALDQHYECWDSEMNAGKKPKEGTEGLGAAEDTAAASEPPAKASRIQ